MEALSWMAERGNEQAVAALSTYLEHTSTGVRIAALWAFGRMGTTAKSCFIIAVCGRLQDSHASVRRGAAGVLPQVAGRGNEHAVRAVSEILRQSNEISIAGSWLYPRSPKFSRDLNGDHPRFNA